MYPFEAAGKKSEGGIGQGKAALIRAALFIFPRESMRFASVSDKSEPGARSELASRLEAGLTLGRFLPDLT